MSIFERGNFVEHNQSFLTETTDALKAIALVQQKFNKGDIDTLLNEYHDSFIGNLLGFTKVNEAKNGFDCMNDNGDYLESKVSSASSKSHQATFNDTTFDKADSFKKDNVYIAHSIWKDAVTCICVAYGSNPKIGHFLHTKVQRHKEIGTVRSTQYISFSDLIFKYGFKVIAVHCTKEEVVDFFQKGSSKKLKTLTVEDIFTENEIKANK